MERNRGLSPIVANARWIVMGRNRGLSPIVLLAKIDIHAAFWQLSVPKIVTLGCGFMHDASL